MTRNCYFLVLVTIVSLAGSCPGLFGGAATLTAPADDVKVAILVPVAEIPPYHLFQDSKQFTVVEWPVSKLREAREDTITRFDQLKGKTSRHYKLKPNEPIYLNDIDEPETDRNNLKEGEVAHAIRISHDRAPAGFLKKGDRIDISVTLQPDTLTGTIRTFYFLEDIEVLDGINHHVMNPNQANKNPAEAARESLFLSLRLTKPQALVLKYFSDTAKVDVVRRKPGDPHRVGENFHFSNERFSWGAKFGTTPEQKVLDKWLGHWRTNYTQLKAEWTPMEISGTADLTTNRLAEAQFVQDHSEHSDKTSSRTIFTYDEQKKCYRGWWFSSTGQTAESTGKWDADKKTMTWTSVGEPAFTTTVKHHFVDDDNIEWDVITKDNNGKLLFQMEGKNVRTKPLTK